jgi:hypothetical protein
MIGNGGISGITKEKGYQIINKFGVNFDIDTGSIPETIWTAGGSFPFLNTGIPMDIVSTDANDNLAGTGAQKATITFYNTDNTENIVTIDLNGLTSVPIDNDVKICTRIKIQSGNNLSNIGQIQIVDRATKTIIYQSVEPGEGQTLSAVQICPKDKRGLVKKHSVTYAKDSSPLGSADMRFNLRKNDGSTQVKHPIVISSAKPKDEVFYNIGGITMEAGDIVFWECILVSTNDTPIEARFDVEFSDL